VTPAGTLEGRVLRWIAPYWNAPHLVRTRDWALELDPDAPEALQLAALTHDMERHFSGGPHIDMAAQPPDDLDYLAEHAGRSATIVGEFLRAEGAGHGLIEHVQRLIRAHELGGWYDADVLQAADSISFLETNTELVKRWVRDGRCTPEWARAKSRWMFERIQHERAVELARPYYEEAAAGLEAV
jgi:hypothetical protein